MELDDIMVDVDSIIEERQKCKNEKINHKLDSIISKLEKSHKRQKKIKIT